MSGRNSARKYLLVLAAVGMLAALPALADDTPAMEPVSPGDDLTQTPMECLMPSLPTPDLNYGQTLPDALKSGMTSMNDFVQDSAVYLNCMRNKVEVNASIIYQRLLEAARTKLSGAAQNAKKDPPI